MEDAGVSSALTRIREKAKKEKRLQFTALYHHITVDRLRESFASLKRDVSPGVDGVTWKKYSQHLDTNLNLLHQRLHRGAYRAKPSRRSYIPKPDGRQRPLGVASLEDKLVQRATVEVMEAIYEADFLGFSYGFRRGRSPHDSLDALAIGLTERRVNWVLDADIQGFFDTISHEWMMQFLQHRISDRRLLRLIRKWLIAGVMEDGKRTATSVGTPQGATISPLLANIYLHYVFDLWVQKWRKDQARGEVIVTRWADDFVVGFQHRHEAERFLKELRERFEQFGLKLHPDKTRLIEFGRFAIRERRAKQEKKPESFTYLGLTHICGVTRNGRFLLRRHTEAKRMRSKLSEVKTELRVRMHLSVPEQGKWLGSVLRGYMAYHAVPTNIKAMRQFRTQLTRHWLKSLNRRSQRDRTNWKRLNQLVNRWLPPVKIQHPFPDERFYRFTQGRSPVR